MGDSNEHETPIWGCKAIAAFIGQTPAATFHLLEGGKIPARRVGRRWAADREVLRRFFAGEPSSGASP